MEFHSKIQGPELCYRDKPALVATQRPATNPLLECGPEAWHFARPGLGTRDYRFVGNVHEDDPRCSRVDDTTVHADIATRAVGSVCHGLDSFRRMNTAHWRAGSRGVGDALVVARAYAATVLEDVASVAVDVTECDLRGEIRGLLKPVRQAIDDFVKEIVKFLAAFKLPIDAALAASVGPRKKINFKSNEPTFSCEDDSFRWDDFKRIGHLFARGAPAPAPQEDPTVVVPPSQETTTESKEKEKIDDTAITRERADGEDDGDLERERTAKTISDLLRALLELRAKVDQTKARTMAEIISSATTRKTS